MKNTNSSKISRALKNIKNYQKSSNIIINSWKFLSRNMVPKVIAKSSQSHRRKARYLRRFREVIPAKHVIYDVLKVIAKSSQSHRKVIAEKHVIYGVYANHRRKARYFTEISQSHRRKAHYLRRIRKAIAAKHVIYGDFAKSSQQRTLFSMF